MLKAFNGYYAYNESGQWTHYPAHIDALKDARKQLASTKNVAVFFTYINNFSALYEGFRGSGTDLYVNTSLGPDKWETPRSARRLTLLGSLLIRTMTRRSPAWGRAITAMKTRYSRSTSTAAITEITAGGQKSTLE